MKFPLGNEISERKFIKMITKGTMMKALKEKGIRVNSEGKRLHQLKASEIAVMYFDTFGSFTK